MNQAPRPSSSTSRRNATQSLDGETQRRDIRLFERNMQKSLSALRTLRLRYQCIFVLMILSSTFWSWRLRGRLTSPHQRTVHEEARLWLSWALLGVVPPLIFFLTGMYRKTVVEPRSFVEQLNRSLVQFCIAYSEESNQLYRVLPPESPRNEAVWKLRSRYRRADSS